MKKYVSYLLVFVLVGVWGLFAIMKMWLFKTTSSDFYEIIRQYSGQVFLSDDRSEGSQNGLEAYYYGMLSLKIDPKNYPQDRVRQSEVDQALLSGLPYFSGEIKELSRWPIYLIEEVPHLDSSYPERSMLVLSGNMLNFYEILGKKRAVFSFTYPESFLDSLRMARNTFTFTSKQGTLLSLGVDDLDHRRLGLDYRRAGVDDQTICNYRIPRGTMFIWGGGDILQEEKRSKMINWYLRYTATLSEQMENEHGIHYSYNYSRCRVKDKKVYVLSALWSNPIEEELIAGIEKNLIAY